MTTSPKEKSWQLQVLLLPCVLLVGALVIYPALYSIYLSLTNASLVGVAATHPRFVGLRNYLRLFSDGEFWSSLLVTVWFVMGSSFLDLLMLVLHLSFLLPPPHHFYYLYTSYIHL